MQTSSNSVPTLSPISHPVLLYDGVCGLCNRMNQFVLAHDRDDRFRFASLQSSFAAQVLGRHGKDPHDLDTVYAVVDCGGPGERLLARSDAVVFVLQQLGGIWSLYAALLRCLPRNLRNWGYDRVAQNRYRLFGRYDTCPLPSDATRAKFLDV